MVFGVQTIRELQVTPGYTSDSTFRQICDLTFNMASSGATAGCSDIGIGGDLVESLIASPGLWESPPWPVDGFAQIPSALPDSSVYPIGISGISTSQFTMTFDGRGNIRFPDSLSAEPEFTGVLVKQ